VFESELADHIPVVHASIGGCRIVGRLCVGNSKGLLLPNTTTDQELWHIRNSLPESVVVQVIRGPPSPTPFQTTPTTMMRQCSTMRGAETRHPPLYLPCGSQGLPFRQGEPALALMLCILSSPLPLGTRLQERRQNVETLNLECHSSLLFSASRRDCQLLETASLQTITSL
jgi:hypothetical protein